MPHRLSCSLIAVALLLAACRGGRPAAQLSSQQDPDVWTYRQLDTVSLRAYVFRPVSSRAGGATPAVILLHGGGWSAGSPEWVFGAARRFAATGLVALAVEYRLSGPAATPADALGDVCEALKWIRREHQQLGVDPMRVAAYGVSAGGQLAAAAATIGCQSTEGRYGLGGPDALLLLSPALDLARDGYFERLLRGQVTAAALSPIEHGRARMPPTSIVHGEDDTLTPISGARRFCELVTFGGATCELNSFPRLGHLLTRNLANQEDDFDPDPKARDEGIARQLAFVRALWIRN